MHQNKETKFRPRTRESTSLTMQAFEQTTNLLKILGNAELQNRMGLDYLLAASGGLCHIIGQECCMWAPDDLDNLTHIDSHILICDLL